MSAGASAATTACDVGTQSISPMTKIRITSAITGAEPFRSGAGTARPSSASRRRASPTAGCRAVHRVSRSWKTVTSSGLTIISTPQAAGARLCVVVSRDRQQRLGRDVGHRREDRREHEEQERMVADDHAERPALRRARRARTRRRAGCSGRRSRTRAAASGSDAEPEVVPVAADQEQAAERRPDRDSEVAARRAPTRTPASCRSGDDEVGDHRLVGRAAERAEDRQQRRAARGPRRTLSPTKSRPSGTSALEPPAEQDQRPAADPVRRVAAEVADDARQRRRRPGRRSRERCCEACSSLIAQMPRNGIDRRAGDRARQADGEHRPQGAVDVVAPDQAEDACEERHGFSVRGRCERKARTTSRPRGRSTPRRRRYRRRRDLPMRNPQPARSTRSARGRQPIRNPVRSAPTSIRESRGPAPSAAPM